MDAYSPDLRIRIVAAVDGNQSPTAVAERFGVHVATVYRYLQRRRDTKSLARSPIPGRPPTIPPEHYPELIAHVAAHPDATLAERCAWWEAEHAVSLSKATMSRLLARLGTTHKKRP
jgi:transposase